MRFGASWIATAALLLIAIWLAWWGTAQRKAGDELRAERTGAAENTRKLAGQVEALQRETAALREQLLASGVEPVRTAGVPRASRPGDDSDQRLESVRLLAQVQAKLNAANDAIQQLQGRTQDLETNIEKLTAENRQLSAEESELRSSLASTRTLIQALESEMKSKTDRIAQLEAASRTLREDAQKAGQRATQLATAVRELEDINRRRENYLTSLQRRYRELTDQYRALAVRLETQRDNPVAFAPDVSRIQSTVQLAEDDLRQLNSLNTQAQRLAQKLASR
jgi:chromosome segregation ATPase